MQWPTTFGGCWLVPMDCTPAGGCAAHAQRVAAMAILDKCFMLSPSRSRQKRAGLSKKGEQERSIPFNALLLARVKFPLDHQKLRAGNRLPA
jgi:hypothetical protein